MNLHFLRYCLSLSLIFSSCSLLEQNEIIRTEEIGDIKGKKLIYSLYQTGIDNYRFEFKVVNSKDTSEITTMFLNDASANYLKFEIQEYPAKVMIRVNKPIGNETKRIGEINYEIRGNQ
jgi:hypothetical protein